MSESGKSGSKQTWKSGGGFRGGGSSASQAKLKNTDGIAILFSQSEGVVGAPTFRDFLDIAHPYLREKVPSVADQIVTRVRDAPEEPVPPVEPEAPEAGASEHDWKVYTVKYTSFEALRSDHGRRHAAWVKETRAYVNDEKQCCAKYWTLLSEVIKDRIKEDYPEATTSTI